ncbi:precorrin-2 dehydrogenase/sirohydrochlorin ferrochelatase family protein [Rothia aerolata]|uniref:precorrin-2 dehydrogenase n=1 Tax=Rothia aerolata TaxID=1812262 RepID=A0A917MSK2_9MICC|nr:bifunctional precorrin-2 dehydrogenase/sirohydrochlorin ferrochelatase [Rothia aerolata]GGH58158.1 hypothetical protein GCM10007359_04030 [Rothia aerolata]
MLPVSLRLAGKNVLVVGAGRVAERRIETLLNEDAAVRVVAPEAGSRVQELVSSGQVELSRRGFEEADLDGAWLVFAHTSSPELNSAIAEICRQRRIWCLIGGDAHASDLWMMAHRQVDADLTVAVSAHGNPRRAKRVVEQLVTEARKGVQ